LIKDGRQLAQQETLTEEMQRNRMKQFRDVERMNNEYSESFTQKSRRETELERRLTVREKDRRHHQRPATEEVHVVDLKPQKLSDRSMLKSCHSFISITGSCEFNDGTEDRRKKP